ncbi:InlB B-repeat-containing protein [Clostridium sp. YIM B02505]|uniref:InlB B-repeat-containing protein n=1 Tax=Clostridium yunnanense TaxID=2800325 RepID=A0ABS1EUS7_9CLOT|nr:InlB B-repeat-containing protein [Clostridium yunnanense]MBK1813135.1 InlB B-repeat-containing protein [Clostridium yunnanense]
METKVHKSREKSFMEKVFSILLSLIFIVTILPPTNAVSADEEIMSVVMGTPTWSSTIDYSFKDAVVKGTNITSIMIKGTNYTGIMSVPSSPAVSATLRNTSGTTTMQTYVFSSGITSVQAQNFIRGIVFRFTPNAVVTITVDGNKTNLPQGASITQLNPPNDVNNPHYYMFVNNIVPWQEAYNTAKQYNFMGMKGYLVTITSQAEDQVLTNISALPAWAGGTRLTKDSNKTAILDDDFINPLDISNEGNVFYWATGPEAGGIFYLGKYAGGRSFGYTNWTPGEPNYVDGKENTLQVNYMYQNNRAWNDLPVDYAASELLSGYFVEFSKYDKGMDQSYSAIKSSSASYTMPASGPAPALANFLMFGNFDYNGERKGLLPIISGVSLTLNTDYTILYTGRNSTVYNSADAPIYPGQYTINIILTPAGLQKAFVENELSNDFEITKAVLTPSGIANPQKNYDGNTSLPGGSVTSYLGKIGNDDVGINYASAQFDNANVGDGKSVTVSGLSLTGMQSSYYTLSASSFTVNNGQIVESVPGEVTNQMFDDKTVTYNGEPRTNVLSALPMGVSSVTYSYEGIGLTFYGPTEVPPKNAGIYSVTASFTMQTGYKQLAAVTKKLTINKAEQSGLTITGIPTSNITYGDTFSVGTSGGNGDGKVTYSSTNTDVAVVEGNEVKIIGVGSFAITANKEESSDGTYNPVSSTSSNYTTVKKELKIAGLTAVDREYNGTNIVALTGGSLVGIVGNDDANSVMPTMGIGSSKDVGLRTVAFEAPVLTGTKKDNYYLVQPEVKVNIAKKEVKINGVTASNKVYDGNALAKLTNNGTLSENYDSENLKITVGQGNFINKNAGKDLEISFTGFALSGTEAANYNLSVQPGNIKANIDKAQITINPTSSQSKYYGEKDQELQYKYEGNTTGETPFFENKLTRESGETIGSYEIFLGDLVLKDNGTFLKDNYDLVLNKEKVLFKVLEYTTDKNGALNPAQGKENWHTGQVVLTAPEGYEISDSNALEGNTWSNTINLDSTDGKEKIYKYYLRNNSTGAITTTAKEALYKVDSHVPKINKDEIKYDTVNDGVLAGIGRFLSFGNFFKKSFRVTLDVSDVGDSTAYSIEYIVKDADGNELLKGSSKVEDKKAILELPMDQIKDEQVTIEIYPVDVAGNEGERILLKGKTSDSTLWYVSDKTPTVEDFKLKDAVMNDGQEITDVSATVTAKIKDEGGIYKVSYKFDSFTNYVDITEGFGKSEKLTKEYTFTKQFNSSGEHYLELKVENNSGVTTIKKIHFTIKTPESAKKLTISANGSAYFEGDSIKVKDLEYNVSGLSKDEKVQDILDTSNVMAVIDDKIVSGDSIVLTKGAHTLSFNNIAAKGYSIVYNKAELMVYEKLTVSFKDSDGKELLKDAFAQKGQLLNIPDEPVKAGSAFVGWSTEKNGSKLWNFTYDKVNNNMNLYAVWSNKIYSVTMRTNNGTPDVIYSSVAYGKRLAEPKVPTLENASFAGWYQDSSLTKPWNFEKDIVKGNTTIYAKFTKDTYTVSFAPVGSETLKPITGINYDQLVRPIPSKPEDRGKLFAGWYLDKELTQPFEFAFDTVKSNITLYPKWVDKTYTIFGGVTDASGNIMKETKVEILKNQTVLAAATTDEHGLFRFIQVPKGSYSLRATDEKRNVAMNINVEDKDLMELVLAFPSSAVSVAPSKENSTKGIYVDKLDKIFDFTKANYLTVTEQKTLRNGGKVEVKVDTLDEQKISPEKIKEVQQYISSLGKVSGELYNVEIEKLVYDNTGKVSKGYISETNEPITVKIKLTASSKNKNNYQIVREHNGEMQMISKEPVNGEYFEVNGDELIVHSKKFSTFAVVFDKHYAPMISWLIALIPLGLLIALLYTKNKIKTSEKIGGES